jgi:hypothetical protein
MYKGTWQSKALLSLLHMLDASRLVHAPVALFTVHFCNIAANASSG